MSPSHSIMAKGPKGSGSEGVRKARLVLGPEIAHATYTLLG